MMANKKEKIDWRIMIAIIAAIVILELYAISKGINGILLTTCIGVLAALAGISLPQYLKTR
jgi:dolichyl-phosphate-mannose--protein O-mannosyl transferase